MEPLRCCVIDDEPLAVRLIASYVERTPSLRLCGTYTSATDAVRPILDGEIDLVFLDIEMPQIGGMEFARILPPACRVVFTTAYERYAVQGFRVGAIDYLLKPVSYEEFAEAAARAVAAHSRQQPQRQQREFLIVKSEYRMVQIRISDISLVEGLKDYIKIHVAGQQKPVLTLMSMRAIEQALPPDTFMRVHRSYIVNTSRISVIERGRLFVGDQMVPVSESYRQQFADYVASLSGDQA